MAWVTPPTAAAGSVLTAATWNQVRDDLKALLPLDVLAWTSYTPTLTQSATVTKTVNYAKYQQISKSVTGKFQLTVTGSGTAANAVLIGLPVTASLASVNDQIGTGFIFDASTGGKFRGMAVFNSTTTIKLLTLFSTADGYLGSTDFTAGLAVNDVVTIMFGYEAA